MVTVILVAQVEGQVAKTIQVMGIVLDFLGVELTKHTSHVCYVSQFVSHADIEVESDICLYLI